MYFRKGWCSLLVFQFKCFIFLTTRKDTNISYSLRKISLYGKGINLKNLKKNSKNFHCRKKFSVWVILLQQLVLGNVQQDFLDFHVNLRDITLIGLRSMPSLVILAATGALPKCLGQAEPRHKHIMFHAFPKHVETNCIWTLPSNIISKTS